MVYQYIGVNFALLIKKKNTNACKCAVYSVYLYHYSYNTATLLLMTHIQKMGIYCVEWHNIRQNGILSCVE